MRSCASPYDPAGHATSVRSLQKEGDVRFADRVDHGQDSKNCRGRRKNPPGTLNAVGCPEDDQRKPFSFESCRKCLAQPFVRDTRLNFALRQVGLFMVDHLQNTLKNVHLKGISNNIVLKASLIRVYKVRDERRSGFPPVIECFLNSVAQMLSMGLPGVPKTSILAIEDNGTLTEEYTPEDLPLNVDSAQF